MSKKIKQYELNPSCSLLLSTYNWPEALDLCLSSIFRQSVLPNEILIADDGSSSMTKIVVDRYIAKGIIPIKHIWQSDVGFRKCLILNKAMHNATTEYIVQIDGDIILEKHFLQDHLLMAEKGCFVRGTRSHIIESFLTTLFRERKVDFNFLSKGVKHRFNALRIPLLSGFMIKKKADSHNVRGCNMAFWKADFIQVNGYNNALSGWGHEDEELATRLVNSGLLKKSVKLRCVQFHIFHPFASRASEHSHDDTLQRTRESGEKRCSNGFDQIEEAIN